MAAAQALRCRLTARKRTGGPCKSACLREEPVRKAIFLKQSGERSETIPDRKTAGSPRLAPWRPLPTPLTSKEPPSHMDVASG